MNITKIWTMLPGNFLAELLLSTVCSAWSLIWQHSRVLSEVSTADYFHVQPCTNISTCWKSRKFAKNMNPMEFIAPKTVVKEFKQGVLTLPMLSLLDLFRRISSSSISPLATQSVKIAADVLWQIFIKSLFIIILFIPPWFSLSDCYFFPDF